METLKEDAFLRPAAAARNNAVVVDHVTKVFTTREGRDVLAVDDTSLAIRDGQFVSIVGPSGCGKTTLLNLAAGLLPPEVSRGTILVGGNPPVRGNRDIAYMLARDALCPWRTALGNAELGTEIRGMSSERRRKRALDLLAQVSLKGFENAYPKQLSQGMRQRVALARTFGLESQILLMDEPFGALDALTREQMNLEMLRIWRESGKTILFVTHSIQEAVFLASHCAVLTAGPARMAEYFPIELPFPRSLPIKTTDEFGAYARRIYARLGLSPGS